MPDHNKEESKPTAWRRAPLALAVATALASPVMPAQAVTAAVQPVRAAAPAPGRAPGAELVVIDGAVEDVGTLLQAVPPGADWVVLDSGRDGLAQLAELAARYKNLRALHLLSHGGDGRLTLGSSELNRETIQNYRDELTALAAAMAPGADLLLYGCEVAKSEEGERFIAALKAGTGLDIAASDDITRDGEWDLEIAQGGIETLSLRPEGYRASLAGSVMAGDGSGGGGGAALGNPASAEPVYQAGNGGDGGGDDDTVTGGTGDDILFGDGSGGGGGGASYEVNVGSGGAGGGGHDTLSGGAGNDILFGDGFDGQSGSGAQGGDGGYGGGGGGGAYNLGMFGRGGIGGGDGANNVSPTAGNSYGDFAEGGQNYATKYGGGAGWSGDDGTTAGDGGDGAAFYAQAGYPGHTSPPANISDDGSIRASVLGQIATLAALPGGAGDDVLDGGPGSDELVGMGGSDTFRFEVTDGPTNGGTDTDTVHDFTPGTDKLAVYFADTLYSAQQVNALVAAQIAAGNDRTLVLDRDGYQVSVVISGIGADLDITDFDSTNEAPTFDGTPAISGTPGVGATLSLVDTATTDPDGDSVTLSYQWQLDGSNIAGATSATYVVQSGDSKGSVTCVVTAADGYGGTDTATTAPVTINLAPAFDATPTISGNAEVGGSLSLLDTGATDPDGDVVTLSYQWQLNGVDLTGETSATYVVQSGDRGGVLTCVVTAEDGYGGIAEVTTAGVTINTPPLFDATPAISGEPIVGATLSLTDTATSDADGDSVSLSYQWRLNGVAIVGATSATYMVQSGDTGGAVTAEITADDGNGGVATVTTNGVTIANSDPSFAGTPTISGNPAVGETLSLADTGTTDADGDSVSLSYQWRLNGVAIVGATSATYTAQSGDAGGSVTCVVTAADGNGGVATATTGGVTIAASGDAGGGTVPPANSAPSFVVTPSISGNPAVGETLSLVDTDTTDADGDSVSLSYQWQRDGVDIAGAVSATYLVQAADAGVSVACVITADDGNGGIATATTGGVTIAVSGGGGGGSIVLFNGLLGLLLGALRFVRRKGGGTA